MNTTQTLSSLLIAVALLCSAAFAEDALKVTIDNDGLQRVAFTLHGKTSCVMLDGKIFCATATTRAPIKLASTASD